MDSIKLKIDDSVVTKVRDDTNEIIFADRYERVIAILTHSIERIDDMKARVRLTSRGISSIYDCRIHNSIFVNGRRGAGKTHFLINLESHIERNAKSIAGNIFISRPFDPTLIDETETYLSALVAHLIREYELRVESSSPEAKRYQTEVDLAIDEVANALDSQQKAVKSTGMDNIGYYHAGGTLEQAIHTLLGKMAETLGVKVIVLPIDDIDMVPRRAWDVLNILRRYLASPYLVPVVSGQFDLYHNILHTEVPRWFNLAQERHIKPPPEPDFDEWRKITSGRPWLGPEGDGRPPDRRTENERYHDVFVNDIADGYFSKIFPRQNEVRLDSILDNGIKGRIILCFGAKKITLNDYIALETAAIHFGITNPRQPLHSVTEFHRSLREFLQYLAALSQDIEGVLNLLASTKSPNADNTDFRQEVSDIIHTRALPNEFICYRNRVVEFAKNSRYWKLDPFLFQTLSMERSLPPGKRLTPGALFRCLRSEASLPGRVDVKAVQRIDLLSDVTKPLFRVYDARGKVNSIDIICAALASTDDSTQHYDGRPQVSIANMFQILFDSFSPSFELSAHVAGGFGLLNLSARDETQVLSEVAKMSADIGDWRNLTREHVSLSQIRLALMEYGRHEEDILDWFGKCLQDGPLPLRAYCRLHLLALVNGFAVLEKKSGISRLEWRLQEFEAAAAMDVLPLAVQLNCPEVGETRRHRFTAGFYGALLEHPIVKSIIRGKGPARMMVVGDSLMLSPKDILRLIQPPPLLLVDDVSIRISAYLDWMAKLRNDRPRLGSQIGRANRNVLIGVLAEQTGALFTIFDLLWRNEHRRPVTGFLSFLGLDNMTWDDVVRVGNASAAS